jgi:hypothetical protein
MKTLQEIEGSASPKHKKVMKSAEKSKRFGKKKAGAAEEKQPWSRRKKIVVWSSAGVLALVIVAVGFFFFMGQPVKAPSKPNLAAPTQPEEVKVYSPLTGRLTTEKKLTAPVLAVMIENSTDARPQSGLKDAGVVFEAVAEGGITRFIALYQEAEPSLIGPVRSIRPYYLEWAAAFAPYVAHVGGSDEATTMIRSGNYGVDLDEFANGSSYWRATDRFAPHNVYTDYSHMDARMASIDPVRTEFTAWPRQDGQAIETPDATSIDVPVSTGAYAVHYDYDAATNTYKRLVGGQPHLDREQGQLAPDVVIALRVSQSLQSDNLHNTIQTTGTNTAYIFQNGTVTEGTWSKADAGTQMKFTDSAGNEITLNRGQTWITAVTSARTVTWQ